MRCSVAVFYHPESRVLAFVIPRGTEVRDGVVTDVIAEGLAAVVGERDVDPVDLSSTEFEELLDAMIDRSVVLCIDRIPLAIEDEEDLLQFLRELAHSLDLAATCPIYRPPLGVEVSLPIAALAAEMLSKLSRLGTDITVQKLHNLMFLAMYTKIEGGELVLDEKDIRCVVPDFRITLNGVESLLLNIALERLSRR